MQNKNIPIFLASNDKYAPFVATTIASVCYNTKSFCEFYILDSGISDLNKKRIELLKERFGNFSIEYLHIDLSKFNSFQLLPHISLDTYSRFFIPLLKPKLDKVIYLDVDIVVLGDIQNLYNIDLEEHFLGAVPEYFPTDCQIKIAKNLNIKYNENKQFFNAGILLINSKRWREDNIIEKLFEIQSKYSHKLTNGDQDILIKQFYEDYIILDSRFNLLSGQIVYKDRFSIEVEKMINNAIKNPIVRHFETQNKPWLTNENFYGGDLQNFNDFWFFVRMTDFYDSIKLGYIDNLINKKIYRKKNKRYLFNIVPLVEKNEKNNNIWYKLFNFLPLLKISKSNNINS